MRKDSGVHLSTAFTTYWPLDYVSRIRKAGDVGAPLKVVFGGGHSSFPAPSFYGAKQGDVLFPISVTKKTLHIIGQLKIESIIPIEQYLKDVLQLPEQLCSLSLFDLTQQLATERPELGHRAPHDCIYEAAIGDGSSISITCVVPPLLLDSLRLVNRKGESRCIPYVSDGQVHRSFGLQGHCYRLCDSTAALFSRLLVELQSHNKTLNPSGGSGGV